MTSSRKKILIVGPAWVGDMVMAQSLFMNLQAMHDNIDIDVLAPSWSLPLLARMPEVNQAIPVPIQHGQLGLSLRFKIGRQIKKNNYQQAIVLPRSFKAALIPFFAGIPQRTGYRGEMRYGVINDMRELDKSILTQTVQRYAALGLSDNVVSAPHIYYPSLIVDKDNQKALLEKLKLSTEKPIICIMPGAEYGPAKQWPIAKYHELAGTLADKGFQIWVIGSEKEKSVGQQIQIQGMNDIINLCGQTSLVDAIDLIALAETAVCNDSGLMHVACATGRKVAAIYGSSSPSYTPPLSDHARVIYHDLECSPCFERHCPLQHTKCLQDIDVNEVLECITLQQETGCGENFCLS